MLPVDVLERYTRVWPAETLPARAAAVARAHPDRIAYLEGANELRFGTAHAAIDRLAGHLAARGIGPGDVVSWQLPNIWEAAIVHHAIVRAGAIANPLGIGLREHELRAILTEAKPRALFVAASWRGFDHLGLARALADELDIAHLIAARGDSEDAAVRGASEHAAARGESPGALDELLHNPAEPPAMPSDPAALALLLYTSGTTSAPKGVLHTHRSLLTEVDSFRVIHGLTAADRALCGPPVTHIAGLAYGVLAPMALGTSSVLLDRWDAPRAAQVLDQHGVTFMTGPPTFLVTMAEHVDAPPPAFRLFSTGGATIPVDAIAAAGARLGCLVKRAYGSTEVPTLTAGRLEDDERARLHTDGALIGEAEMRIDPSGEILARAPEMFVGYQSGATDAWSDGWFRTGDLGTIDGDGRLRVTGRLKDIIIRGGENISASEVEDLVRAHPSVADVAVIGLPDPRLGERACAVVVASGPAPTLQDLVEHLRARGLSVAKLPEHLRIVDALPRSDNGKVLKDELRARFA